MPALRQAPGLRPPIAPPREIVPLPLVVVLTALLAGGLFVALEARRSAAGPAAATPPPVELASMPDLAIPPPAPAPAPPAATGPAPRIVIHAAAPTPPPPQAQPPLASAAFPLSLPPSPAAPPPAPPYRTGEREPALVIDLTAGTGVAISGAGNGAGSATADAAADDTARASVIRNRASLIAQGTILAATLETPLDSDRPGLARAVVAADVRGFDGSRVLIPRGSRLIGEFRAEANPALRRVLVTWTRLIRPDGVAIRIASPGTDALGGAGIPGSVNTHFAARFASAVLQSALMIGVNVASDVSSAGGGVVIGLPAQAAQLGQQLVPNLTRPPTVKVRGGAEIAVLVAHDLDFAGTPAVR